MKNINPLILDTTFILPLFGIETVQDKGFEKDIRRLWNNNIKGYNVYLPSTCLIESMFKLLSEYRDNTDLNILERYHTILPSVLSLPIKIIHSELIPRASMIASLIRHHGHTDIMDCWIAGTAVALGGCLLSEDDDLKNKLIEIPETKELVIWDWKYFVREILTEQK